MKQFELIIAALENSEPTGTGWVHIYEQKHQAALAAARELRALKPVGVFEYDDANNIWEEVTPNCEGVKLYALDKATK